MPEARANHACLPGFDAAGTGVWLQNNAWGFATDTDPPQAVGIDAAGVLSWRWHWPARGGADDERVVAYPGVICGRKPFGGLASSTPRLPVRLARVTRLRVAHDLRLVRPWGSGAGNVAFDLWLTRGPDAGEDGILAEVMVWLDHRRLRPMGDAVATLDTPHGRARLYDGRVRHWRYLAFVLAAAPLRGETDLGFFLAYLRRTGRLEGDAWLSSVELGTEICWGQGRAELRGFRVGLDLGPDTGAEAARGEPPVSGP